MAEPSISFRVASADARRILSQRRHDMRVGPQPDYIDPTRSHLNRALYRAEGWNADLTPKAARAFVARSQANMEARAKRKTTAARYWRTAILTLSKSAQERLNALGQTPHDAALEVFTDFAARHGVRLLSVDFHGDESAPHWHAEFEGIKANGYSLRLDRADLSAEQDFAAEKLKQFGLVRGKRKRDRQADGEDPSKLIHRSVKQLHEDLPRELDELQRRIEAARGKAEKNEARAEKARAKAAKLETDERAAADKLAKALKNVETYERRVAAARQEAEDVQAQIEALNRSLAQKKTKVSALMRRLRALNAA